MGVDEGKEVVSNLEKFRVFATSSDPEKYAEGYRGLRRTLSSIDSTDFPVECASSAIENLEETRSFLEKKGVTGGQVLVEIQGAIDHLEERMETS